jgi:type IV pilus assembly protein PilQ
MSHPIRWGTTIIAAAAIALLLAPGPSSAQKRAMGTVSGLRIAQDGARTVVTIVGSATPTFNVFKLERPTRVVVDVANATLDAAADPAQLASTWAVAAVSASQIKDDAQTAARIVITLRRAGDYDVKAQGTNIVVAVTALEAPPLGLAQKEAAPGQDRMRKELEAARAEAQRARAEAEKLRGELEQQKQTTERALADANALKKQADDKAALAERRREEAETARKAAEQKVRAAQGRSQTEVASAQAEAERARQAAESERKAAAEARAQAETARQAAEAQSARLAEMQRQTEAQQSRLRAAEQSRRSSEEQRADEARRKSDEARQAAETAAQKLEAARAQAGEARAEAERAQKAAEAERRAAVEMKAQAEAARKAGSSQAGSERAAVVAERKKAEAAKQEALEAAARLEAARKQLERLQRSVEEERKRAETAKHDAEVADGRAAEASAAREQRTREELRRAELAKKDAEAASVRLEELKRQVAEERRAAAQAKEESARAKTQAEAARQAAQNAKRTAEAAAKQATAERVREENRAQASRGQVAQAEVKRRELEAKIADDEARREALAAARAEEEARSRAAEAARLDAVAKRHAAEEAAQKEEARVKAARDARQREEAAVRELAEARRREEAAAREAAQAGKLALERQKEAQGALARIEDKRRAAEAAQNAAETRRRETEQALARAQAMRQGKRKQEEIAAAAQEAQRRQEAQKSAEAEAARLKADLASANTALQASQSAQRDASAQAARAEERRRAAEGEASRLDEARRGAQVETARAEAARRSAQNETAEVRKELEMAVAARQDEERRRRDAEAARGAEEKKLLATEAARKNEEQKLQALRAELSRLEERRKAALAATGGAASTASPAVAVNAPPAAGARGAAVGGSRSLRVQGVNFVDEPARSSVILDLSAAVSDYRVDRADAHTVVLQVFGAQLSEAAARTLDTTEFMGPVRQVQARQDPRTGAVRVTVDLADDVRSTVRRAGTRLYWDFQKAAPGPRGEASNLTGAPRRALTLLAVPPPVFAQSRQTAGGGGQGEGAPGLGGTSRKKRYTGRRIDIDFKDADIHNVLRLLRDVGQVNIITTDDVKGTVTIGMRNVPWDQALDVVLRAKGLGQVREGNIIRVAPLATLEKELEQEIARQKQRVAVEPIETRMIPLSYTQGENMEKKVQALLSERGRVITDARTNMLIVSDVPRNIELIEELSRSLDTQTAQVLIEARIVEARANFSRDVGVQWGFGYLASTATGNPTGLVFPSSVGLAGGAMDQQTPVSGIIGAPQSTQGGGALGAQSPNFAVNLPAPVGTGSGGALGLTLGSIGGNFNVALRLSALENTGDLRIVSAPKIQTMDNVPATISQGVSIPISQVSAAGVNTVFIDALLKLEVRPKVTNEGTVMLDISLTNNAADFTLTGARGDPSITKKEAKSTMLIKDGDTAVVGGIYVRTTSWQLRKVPWLAEIPIIGWFFKERRDTDDRGEMLIFITPRILNRARAIGQ